MSTNNRFSQKHDAKAVKRFKVFYRCTLYFLLLNLFYIAVGMTHAQTRVVDAHDYTAFWLWGEIRTAPYLKTAKEIYILQGEFRPAPLKTTASSNNKPLIGHSIFQQQGVSILKIRHQKVWLVFRNHHLNWNQQELQHILKRVKQWENSGNSIVGIQIDYDSKTRNLHQYAVFLAALRQQLPAQYQLSITGLLDWGNTGDIQTQQLLKQSLDEIIVQTYQATSTIPQYERYLKKFASLKLPYKIGLVQHGHWQAPSFLKNDPHFKGYVVFLLR